mmetsp:Transcript_110394/g.252733  ORF Transcript_110394/g.252733 Transcript_110394/m.252733 type:complete len:90 (-) Transcript_110394:294-563(-)
MRGDVEAARKINLRIKDLGKRQRVAQNPQKLEQLKNVMRRRGFHDAKMAQLHADFDRLDRGRGASPSSEDVVAVQIAALFARMEISVGG